ncbi:MAG: hypothetical protein IPG54_01760 [Sphingomonadales bacterium]|jgi:hypothetical protein|nr:hypothetical protein [Sphingomonadales bacterium]MBK9003558.1 hypothetical protein [Sphingomonadales bacterium]MBK9268747.1 hypothetical protein [Sphingomonadales bacterium]
MLNHANIEPSGFKVGEYVGYTMAGKTSYLMRIRRGGQGWETYYHEPLSKAAGGCFTYVTARTLKEMSGKLDAMARRETDGDSLPAGEA